ncbi:hypothetical protein HPB48_018639 [Haemaphysalis longicornis]|uniref:Carboxylesterase type B domain-containing protein n=1 Tax=Haemaphysalis longicornis TaxID=44386 RepID=A0A9J6GH79_HAELO|nr:hypothetical protein HPB48_018639 [Haemaphysalis longicornis]
MSVAAVTETGRSPMRPVTSLPDATDYDGALLSSKANAVVVVPNYRLGLLGHTTLNGSVTVPLGLGDQLTAIRWLQENVGLFGGNASRLVLMGHGAGAASVGHWMLTTRPELTAVRRFIMISGSPYNRQAQRLFVSCYWWMTNGCRVLTGDL